MRAYSYFAEYYDELTENVSYQQRADYFCSLLRRYSHDPGIVLDLACGTGSFTLELAKRGLDIYGIDASPEMLSVAQQKAAEAQMQILFLCQKMQCIDLYGTVDTVFCTLDSINHLTEEKDVQQTFDRISLFLDPEGLFIFDVNTIYKHQKILGNQTFVYDLQNIYCVWQNFFYPERNKVRIHLDFFERNGAVYHRTQEEFFERAYSEQEIDRFLLHAGMEKVDCFADLSFEAPQETTQRMIYIARKKK